MSQYCITLYNINIIFSLIPLFFTLFFFDLSIQKYATLIPLLLKINKFSLSTLILFPSNSSTLKNKDNNWSYLKQKRLNRIIFKSRVTKKKKKGKIKKSIRLLYLLYYNNIIIIIFIYYLLDHLCKELCSPTIQNYKTEEIYCEVVVLNISGCA